jgi:hypothetical protein
MTVIQAACQLYDYACGDASKAAEIENELNSAISSGLLTKGGMADVTSASKNGVAYSKTVSLKESERIQAMRTALICLKNHTRPSSRSFARF